MAHNRSTVATSFLRVGKETYPIYGDEKDGWSIDEGDLCPRTPTEFRYRSIEELFFALVNFNASDEGRA